MPSNNLSINTHWLTPHISVALCQHHATTEGKLDELASLYLERTVLSWEQKAWLKTVSAKRRCDFILGRHCAQGALEQLLSEMPQLSKKADRSGVIPRAASGMPLFPDYASGSISHTSGLAVSAVCLRSKYKCLGIDVEPLNSKPVQAATIDKILSAEEKKLLSDFFSRPCSAGPVHLLWFKLAFSAKESIYKALFPMARRYFGFECAKIIGITEQKIEIELSQKLLMEHQEIKNQVGNFAEV